MGSARGPGPRRARPGARRHPRGGAGGEAAGRAVRAGHGTAARVPARTCSRGAAPETLGQPPCPSPLPTRLSPAPGRQSPSPLLSHSLLLPRWVLAVTAPFQVKTQGGGKQCTNETELPAREETLSRQKVPLPNNIFVSACTMLSCPAPLSRLYGKYYINGFVQIDS